MVRARWRQAELATGSAPAQMGFPRQPSAPSASQPDGADCRRQAVTRTRRIRAVLVVAATCLAVPDLSARNWPQWRGPSSHGVSLETGLPTTWSTKQNLAWRASLSGTGTSSPIVWEDRVIVTSQVGR